jgi:SET domain-containing protein
MLLIDTTARPSAIHGLGCFANEALRSGQLVWVFNRRIESTIMESKLHRLPLPTQAYFLHFAYLSTNWRGRCYVLCGDNARYMNHSDHPNLVNNAAVCDIDAGEELTVDYFSYDLDADRKLGRKAPPLAPHASPANNPAPILQYPIANGRPRLRRLRAFFGSSPLPQVEDEHNARSWTDEYSFSLKPSPIEGVGVFANHAIARGTWLRLFSEPWHRRFRRSSPMSPERRDFLKRYCIENEKVDAFFGPRDFGRMSVGWYLNHSPHPNAAHRKFKYFAVRDIATGEEVTIDYGTLEPRVAQGTVRFPA